MTNVFQEDVPDLRRVRLLHVERALQISEQVRGEAEDVADVAEDDVDAIRRKHFRTRARLFDVTLHATNALLCNG